MKRYVVGLMGATLACVAAVVALAPAPASATSASVVTKWDAQAIVSLTLTTNYTAGFGQVKATFGTVPAPTHGPNASPGAGAVDFGDLLAGVDYLYKYAAHVNVVTNDASGFKIYGEGAADFTNNTDHSTTPLSTTLFYMHSTSGSPADGNDGYNAPEFPFQKTTSGGVVAGGYAGPAASINYGGSYPSTPVASSVSPTGDFYYDYLLKPPASASAGQYYVWIVYTVVGS